MVHINYDDQYWQTSRLVNVLDCEFLCLFSAMDGRLRYGCLLYLNLYSKAFRQTSIPSKRFTRLYTNDWKSSEVKKSTFSSILINVRCKFTINHHRFSLSPYIFESTYAITKYTNRQPLFSLSSYRNSWHSVNINHLLSNLHRYW